MKKLMLLGAMLGFGIGASFGRLQNASDSTILWRACVAAAAAGLLMRWWGRMWMGGLRDSLAHQLRQRHQQASSAASTSSKPAASNPR
jgi:hypothetical protein